MTKKTLKTIITIRSVLPLRELLPLQTFKVLLGREPEEGLVALEAAEERPLRLEVDLWPRLQLLAAAQVAGARAGKTAALAAYPFLSSALTADSEHLTSGRGRARSRTSMKEISVVSYESSDDSQ